MKNSTATLSRGKSVSAAEKPAEMSPFVVEYFMVRGRHFLGMAYRDGQGKWRNASNDEEVTGDISFLD